MLPGNLGNGETVMGQYVSKRKEKYIMNYELFIFLLPFYYHFCLLLPSRTQNEPKKKEWED